MVDAWKGIYQGAVSSAQKWKNIPASDARLRAMARLYVREEVPHYRHELNLSLQFLSDNELGRFQKFFKNESE
jgi:hypothetical protein